MSYQQSKAVDAYIARFSGEAKERLTWLRSVTQATFPKTIEAISYGIPTYRPAPKKRGIVHFGASKDHIGIYGIFESRNNATLHDKMQPYRTGRGTLQFRHSEKLPKAIIRQILADHASKHATTP